MNPTTRPQSATQRCRSSDPRAGATAPRASRAPRNSSPTHDARPAKKRVRDAGRRLAAAADGCACEQRPCVATVASRAGDGRAQPARQLPGQEHLGPLIDRAIDRRAEHDVERQVEPERLRRHAQRVLAQGHAARRARRWRAGARRPRDRWRRARASSSCRGSSRTCRARFSGRALTSSARPQRLLSRRAPAFSSCTSMVRFSRSYVGEHARQRRHRQPVGRAGRPGNRGSAAANRSGTCRSCRRDRSRGRPCLANPDRVVPEAEERMIAGPERHHVDATADLRRGAGVARRPEAARRRAPRAAAASARRRRAADGGSDSSVASPERPPHARAQRTSSRGYHRTRRRTAAKKPSVS